MISRRRFIFASAGIVAASSLMPVSTKALDLIPPKLWGDGIHNDSAALQWLFDRAAKAFEPLFLPTGRYRVDSEIIIPSWLDLDAAAAVFIGNGPVFRLKDTFSASLCNLYFDTRTELPAITAENSSFHAYPVNAHNHKGLI